MENNNQELINKIDNLNAVVTDLTKSIERLTKVLENKK